MALCVLSPMGMGRPHALCQSNYSATSLVSGLKGQALTEAKSTVQAIASESARRPPQEMSRGLNMNSSFAPFREKMQSAS